MGLLEDLKKINARHREQRLKAEAIAERVKRTAEAAQAVSREIKAEKE